MSGRETIHTHIQVDISRQTWDSGLKAATPSGYLMDAGASGVTPDQLRPADKAEEFESSLVFVSPTYLTEEQEAKSQDWPGTGKLIPAGFGVKQEHRKSVDPHRSVLLPDTRETLQYTSCCSSSEESHSQETRNYLKSTG
ncbi:hypothetical protein RRG08_015425 [Elysia crispata]|uniref:Uncharacterized protein n=1 Tax=Elysia crispata TaxID=231223 RepID=A0AAE1CZA4_9GAST|nr:hypothetical protein RRG08_015425 [Elysia crispata]